MSAFKSNSKYSQEYATKSPSESATGACAESPKLCGQAAAASAALPIPNPVAKHTAALRAGVGHAVQGQELVYLNLRFVGVGFRGYIIKKMVPAGQMSDTQKRLASRWIVTSPQDGSSSIRILMLKLGQSAMTAYPIPANVNIYCPTDQQQQAENQPLLLTSTDYKLLTDVVSEIKSYKVPDVYKGSGVFLCERLETEKGEQYINETILRKVIKKK